MVNKVYRKWVKSKAKENRHNKTSSEERVYEWLKNHKIKFKSQVAVICSKDGCGYIADFVLYDGPIRNCIIEVDGTSHDTDLAIHNDNLRTQRLEKKGYFVGRIRNSDTLDENVLNTCMLNTIIGLKRRREEELMKKLQN